MALYKVLKDGIRQRTSEGGWSKPKIGDVIKVSDIAATVMIPEGWIEPYGGGATAGEEGRRRRKGGGGWFGGGEAPAAPEPEAVKPQDSPKVEE